MPKLNLPACTSNNSLLEGEILTASQRQTITQIEVLETGKGLCLAVELKWEPGKTWYITTRRNREEPKYYADLTRLSKHLNELAPGIDFLLRRDPKIPESQKTS